MKQSVPKHTSFRLAQVLIAVVIFLNLQCAIQFLFYSSNYALSFQLSGVPGEVAIKGTGILFLMWNIPYLVACANPLKYRISLIEAMSMQLVGLLGETLIFLNIAPSFNILRLSILRFIIYDTAGFFVLVVSYLLTQKLKINSL